MTKYEDYVINYLTTNGEIFCTKYRNAEDAILAWIKLKNSKLVAHASLHNRDDVEVATIGDSGA